MISATFAESILHCGGPESFLCVPSLCELRALCVDNPRISYHGVIFSATKYSWELKWMPRFIDKLPFVNDWSVKHAVGTMQ